MTNATVEIEIIPELSEIDKLKAQIAWLWSAIDEIWESMPQEPEPPERDEP